MPAARPPPMMAPMLARNHSGELKPMMATESRCGDVGVWWVYDVAWRGWRGKAPHPLHAEVDGGPGEGLRLLMVLLPRPARHRLLARDAQGHLLGEPAGVARSSRGECG